MVLVIVEVAVIAAAAVVVVVVVVIATIVISWSATQVYRGISQSLSQGWQSLRLLPVKGNRNGSHTSENK